MGAKTSGETFDGEEGVCTASERLPAQGLPVAENCSLTVQWRNPACTVLTKRYESALPLRGQAATVRFRCGALSRGAHLCCGVSAKMHSPQGIFRKHLTGVCEQHSAQAERLAWACQKTSRSSRDEEWKPFQLECHQRWDN